VKRTSGNIKGAVLSHTLVNATGTLLVLLAHAVLLTWLIRDLGLAAYGIYALLGAMTLQFNLFDDSLGSWVTREVVTRHPADPGLLRRRLGCALTLNILVGLPVLLLVGGLTVVGLRQQPPAILGLVLVFGGLGFAFELVHALGRKILEGQECFARVKTIHVGGLLVRLAGIAAVRWGWPESDRLVAYAAVFLASVAMQAGGTLIAVRSALGFVPRPAVRGFRSVFLEIVSFGVPIFGVKCTSILAGRLDLWMVAAFLTPAEVGLYGIAVRFFNLVIQAVEVSRSFILPLAVRVRRELDPVRFREFFLRATSLSVLLTTGAATVVTLNLYPVLEAWFGTRSLAAAPPLLWLLVFGVTVSFRSVGQTVLLAEGRFAALFAPFLIASLINFVVSVCATLAWGVCGPALGTFVGGVVLVVWNVNIILRELDVARTEFLVRMARNMAVWGIASVAGYVVTGATGGTLGLVAGTGLYVLTHVLLFYAFILGKADRAFLLGWVLRNRERSLAT
jgi:O-antigen/teichoic acid export membrane protein